MKRGHSVTFRQLESAYLDVQRELDRAGLWYGRTRLMRTQVVWCWLPPPSLWGALGFFVEGESALYRMFGFDPGHVYIPKWVLLHGPWQDRGSLRDVLRHEFGHALAYHHPGPVCRSRAFRKAFGARYDESWPQRPTDREDFLSRYAMTSPAEDFAETFARWLRSCGGRGNSHGKSPLPRHATPSLRAKFAFVQDVCRRIGG
ncbi:MAG: putative zinc-binding metallopeptidase [Thermoguttaceae bacterium]|jgi:hypothetical protein